MTTQEIVAKLWNLCNVLRDDGITYHQYVTELTYILFLKMAKETGAENQIPADYRWDVLTSKSGIELKKYYKELLSFLGDNCTGRIREIYQGSATNIDEPKTWRKLLLRSMAWTGILPVRKGWETCMRGCLRKMPMRKNPVPVSILHRACLSM